MKLYLMRHGEAKSSQEDPERGLTDKGKSTIKKLAVNLQTTGLRFNQVFYSTKKRARETAEIMTDVLSPNIIPALLQNITPTDDPALIVSELNGLNEDTLITSHLPFIPNLISILTGQDISLSAISFETGTLVCLEKNTPSSWSIKWSSCPSEI